MSTSIKIAEAKDRAAKLRAELKERKLKLALVQAEAEVARLEHQLEWVKAQEQELALNCLPATENVDSTNYRSRRNRHSEPGFSPINGN